MFISSNILHQTIATFPVNFDEFSMGLVYGWLAPILKTLTNSNQEFSLTDEQSSWVASLHNFGRIGGSFLAALMVDVIGRKPILISCSVTFFSSWLLIMLTREVWVLYAVRAALGVAIGMHDTVSNVYIAENCSPNIRGTFASIAMAFFYAGELVAFALATYLSYNQVAITHAVMAFFFLSTGFFMRETVQFLIMKGKDKSAEKNYYWLNGPRTDETERKFEEIKINVREEKSKASFKELFMTKANFISMRVILAISVLEMFTGFEALTSYASIAFESSDSLTSNEYTILFGFFQLVSICLSSFVIDRFDRRTIFLISFFATAIFHCCTSALYYTHQNVRIPYFSWFIFATITLYATVYSSGILPIYYIIRGELLPQSVKAVGGCMAVCANSATGFVTTKIFSHVSTVYGIHVNFFMFSVFSFLGFVYVYFELPETKGKTLIEIQRSLEEKGEIGAGYVAKNGGKEATDTVMIVKIPNAVSK